MLPNRDMIFEFTLVPSQQDPGKLAANEIVLVYDYAGRMPAYVDRVEPRPPEREPRQPVPQRIPDVEDYEDV